MSFASYTLVAAYFLGALGLAAVSLVEGIEPWFVALAAFACGASLYCNIRKKTFISAVVWNVLAVIVLFLFLADFLVISKSLIVSASRFLTILLALKLFDLKTGRDHAVAFGIVFFQILGAAAATASPAFFVILALFIAGSIFVMMLFTIKRDWETHRKAALKEEALRGIFDGAFFIWISAVATASLAGALALFFILPRMGAGFFERKTLNTVKVTGFSDRVDLGSIGPLKTDDTIVMRVELPQKRPLHGRFYFRGTALDYYDAMAWSRESKGSKPLKRLTKDSVSLFTLGVADGETVEQNILLEPLETEVIFAASHPVEIAGKFAYLGVDDGGSLYLPSPPYSRLEYRAWSALGPLAAPRPEDPKYTDASYITDDAARTRIMTLIAGVIKRKKSDFAKAVAIEEFLAKGFTYTLDPKKGAGADPIDDFLFFSKEGYCEHYASAMVVMLRLSGVPARIVTGFLPGEWNSLGNYFIVRQRDAHSWVEAYAEHDGLGAWHTFDPTPAAGTEPPAPSQLMLYLDLMRWRWNRYIVNYTFSDQRRVAETLETRASGLFRRLKDALRVKPKLDARSAPPVIAAFLLAAFYYFYKKRALARTRLRIKTPQFYLDMLSILVKKGYVKRAGETPMEFAIRVDNPGVTDITRMFEQERYGGAAIAPAGAEEVKNALDRLRHDLQESPR